MCIVFHNTIQLKTTLIYNLNQIFTSLKIFKKHFILKYTFDKQSKFIIFDKSTLACAYSLGTTYNKYDIYKKY